jgi:hypothetical protein
MLKGGSTCITRHERPRPAGPNRCQGTSIKVWVSAFINPGHATRKGTSFDGPQVNRGPPFSWDQITIYYLTTLLPHYHQYDATEQHKLPPSARLYSKSSRGVSRVLVQHVDCDLGLRTTNAGPFVYPSESHATGYPNATCPPQNQSCACSLSTCFSKSALSQTA